MASVTIDTVTTSPSGQFNLILVEQGRWMGDVPTELRRIQDRLDDTFDAILLGAVAAKYPQSIGQPFTIRFDFYDLGEAESPLRQFLADYAESLGRDSDLKARLDANEFTSSIQLDFSIGSTRQDRPGGKSRWRHLFGAA
jgi:hypothetical protein